MKKSQFITVIILFIAASALIVFGAFGKDFSKSEEATPTEDILGGLIPGIKTPEPGLTEPPVETPSADETESPSAGVTGSAPAETETPSATETTPAIETDESTGDVTTPSSEPTATPGSKVEFPEINNEDFDDLDNNFTYWSSYWKDSGNGQNVPVFDKNMEKFIGDVDYMFINDASASEYEVYMSFVTHFDYGVTGKLLDTLKSADVKATFFVSARYIKENPELVKRMKDEGHLIGTRGPKDTDPAYMTAEEFAEGMLEVEKEYRKLFGENERMTYYRPDSFSARTLKIAESLGYKIVFRTYASVSDEADWEKNGSDSAAIALRFWERGAYEGSIPEFTITKYTSDALSSYLKECKENNVSFKRLDE